MPRRTGIQTVVATVAGNLFLVFGTLVLASLAVATAWVPPRVPIFYFWARAWSRGLLRASGVEVEATHAAPLPLDRPLVLMPNHQSLYDIPVLLATTRVQARFLAKRELFRIPLFGWSLRLAGFVPVERHDARGARESFRQAIDLLRAGASVLVFPEETRSLDGRLLPFKRGGFLLATRSGAAIVPVGIEGTHRIRAKNSLVIHPGTVRVCYGEPIAPEGGGVKGREHLEAAVRRSVCALAGLPPPAKVGDPPTRGEGEATE